MSEGNDEGRAMKASDLNSEGPHDTRVAKATEKLNAKGLSLTIWSHAVESRNCQIIPSTLQLGIPRSIGTKNDERILTIPLDAVCRTQGIEPSSDFKVELQLCASGR